MYTEEINKIALNSCNDDKRIQTFDGFTTYPYGAHYFKICKVKILAKKKVDRPIRLKVKLCNVDKLKYVTIKVTNNFF